MEFREIGVQANRLPVAETHVMPPAPIELPLPYAGPGVRSAPPRTLPRVLGRWVWNVVWSVTRLIQALLLGLGYLVLGAAVFTRALLSCLGRILLFAGRLRWDGPAVRVWWVRTFNRARLRVTRPFRRRGDVPLARPHS